VCQVSWKSDKTVRGVAIWKNFDNTETDRQTDRHINQLYYKLRWLQPSSGAKNLNSPVQLPLTTHSVYTIIKTQSRSRQIALTTVAVSETIGQPQSMNAVDDARHVLTVINVHCFWIENLHKMQTFFRMYVWQQIHIIHQTAVPQYLPELFINYYRIYATDLTTAACHYSHKYWFFTWCIAISFSSDTAEEDWSDQSNECYCKTTITVLINKESLK